MAMIPYSVPNNLLTGNPNAAPDLNELREDVLLLDMLSYRGRVPYTDQTRILNDNGGNPAPLGRMSFQFRTGMTTATFVIGYTQGPMLKSATLQISLNGVSALSTALLTSTNTYTITLTGRGYTDYQFIDVIAQVQTGTGVPADWDGGNIFRVYDAYVSPINAVVTTSWPGVPTFGSDSAANLAQLASAIDWLMTRLTVTTPPVFFTHQYRGFASWASTDLVWQGGIAKSNGCDRLEIGVGHVTLTNVSEHLEIFINDILVVTGPTWTVGDSGNYNFDIDISAYADGTLFALRIMFVCVTGSSAPSGWKESRIIISTIHTQRATYTPATPPTVSTIRESITFATLQSRLNAIGTIATNVYNRIQAATDVFDRIRMFRWMPAVDDGQRAYFASQNLYMPGTWRAFDALWVRGSNLKIGYGPRIIEPTDDNAYAFTWTYEQELISGDEVRDVIVYLDSFQGLYPGMPFYILGADCRAVFSQLR